MSWNNHSLDGCQLEELANRYGTPLYVYSVKTMENKIQELKQAFTVAYPNTRIAYAAKAFLNKAMVGFVMDQGIYLDVVSGGELTLALEAGMDPERIEFNGNNKLAWEIELAVKEGVGRIIVDGYGEVELIQHYAKLYSQTVPLLFRITPGISADSHDYIVTGKKDSKFGFPLDLQRLLSEIQATQESPYTPFYGFHFHLGSQLFEPELYTEALDLLFTFYDELLEHIQVDFKELNIGGGFGIPYRPGEPSLPYSFFFELLMTKVTEYFEKKGLPRPAVITEPGRSIVGEAGLSLYRVGTVKTLEGIRTYVSVDGGMTDNIRPALYQAKYHGELVGKNTEGQGEVVTICGKCCESGDILIQDLEIPPVESGDLLVVYNTGAYGYSMASNYNLLPKPGIVWVKDGKDYLVTKPQTIQQIYENDLDYPFKKDE